MKTNLIYFHFNVVSLTILLVSLFSFNTGFAAGRAIGKTFVNGRVTSGYGPVEGAEISIQGRQEFVKTDQKGQFLLPLGLLKGNRFRITAGKEGWFNNSQIFSRGQNVEIYLNPVPREDRKHYQFLSPVVCAQCHGKLTKIYDQSKMAHTTSNPLVLQMYNGTDAYNQPGKGPSYKTDNPGNDGDCITCHAPSVAAGNPVSKDLNRALSSPRAEWDGISCDYCHKIRKVVKNKSSPSGYKAIQQRLSSNQGGSILVFGPYKDVAVPPMAASYSSIYEKGQFCSACHSHTITPKTKKAWDWEKVYRKSEWKGFGLPDSDSIPVQTTYQEWKQWQSSLKPDDPNKGKNCQDCHMSWRKEMLPYDNYIVDGGARQMWGTYRQAEDINPHQFDGGTQTQLKTAVSLELEGQIENGILNLTVFVSNTNGGHWIPTGETMRSLMLVLDVKDENEKSLKQINGDQLPDWTGKGNPARGNYAGFPGVAFARVLQDSDGNLNVPFWNASSIASDNRIRPKSTQVHKWQFKLNLPDSEPEVTASLIYRPVFKELAKSKRWFVNDITVVQAAW
jgi:hypothetical protein